MKLRKKNQLQLALTGAMVLAFAGCNAPPPAAPGAGEDALSAARNGRVGGQAQPGAGGQATAGSQAGAQSGQAGGAAQPGAAAVKPSAKLTGQVLDPNGKPLSGVEINTFGGFKATTDADGKFTIDAVHGEDLIFDFSSKEYLAHQVMTSLTEGSEGLVKVTLKPRDLGASKINPKTGGTIRSADGNAILEIPPGALAGETAVNLTWLDPMPSAAFPDSYGQLPGPLVTRDTDGERLSLSPLGFANMQFVDATLAPGAQATLKMKVNPEALRQGEALGMKPDFNSPSTLQQPCYEFDRGQGLWVNPATSKLEKDAAGDVWFVYTVHGKEQPKNYFSLQQIVEAGDFVTGTRTVRTPVTTTVYEVWIGGSFFGSYTSADDAEERCWEVNAQRGRSRNANCNIKTKSTTTYVDSVENIYGQYLRGNVKEQSSYGPFNGRNVDGARVSHNADFFGSTTAWTDGSGNFRVAVRQGVSTLPVHGSSWDGASSTGGGYNMTIPTDGRVKANILGGSLAMTPSGTTNLGAEGWSGSVNKVASRGTTVSLAAPASPLYLRESASLTGTVSTARTLDLGTFTVLRDYIVTVIEQVRGTDNASQPNKANDGDGLAGTAVSGFTDYLTGATSGTTGSNGKWKFTLLGNAPAPTVNADFRGLKTSGGNPYNFTINTDSTYTFTLKGGGMNLEKPGNTMSVTYKVDGVSYTKSFTLAADFKHTLVLARDKSDNSLVVKLEQVEGESSISTDLPPAATIGTGGSGAGEVLMSAKNQQK